MSLNLYHIWNELGAYARLSKKSEKNLVQHIAALSCIHGETAWNADNKKKTEGQRRQRERGRVEWRRYKRHIRVIWGHASVEQNHAEGRGRGIQRRVYSKGGYSIAISAEPDLSEAELVTVINSIK